MSSELKNGKDSGILRGDTERGTKGIMLKSDQEGEGTKYLISGLRRTSLVVQWLRIHPPVQGTQVPSLA